MFSQIEATSPSDKFSFYNFNDFCRLVRGIPGLESVRVSENKVFTIYSPHGLALELSVKERSDSLLILYDTSMLEPARMAWDFGLRFLALMERICIGSSHVSVQRAVNFHYQGPYSYALLPLKQGRPLAEIMQKENFLQLLKDFVLLTSLPAGLKKEKRLYFVEPVRDKQRFFFEFSKQLKRSEESFCQHYALRYLPLFLRECKYNLLKSRGLRNVMQLCPNTLAGIQRLNNKSLRLCRPFCLEYSIVDINLCDLLRLIGGENAAIKSLLIHIYYNLQVPLQFFNLWALDSFIRIMQNWKLPYSNSMFRKIQGELLEYKAIYHSFKSCIPRWYQEPAVFSQQERTNSKFNVTFLYLWQNIKEEML